MEVNTNIINNNDILMSIEKKNNDFEYNMLEKFLTIEKEFVIGSNSYATYKTHILKIYKHYKEKKFYKDEIEMLKSIDIDSIEEYFQILKEKYACSTFNLIRGVNYEFFEYLKVRRHIISINPIDVVKKHSFKKIRESRKEKDTLTIEEMRHILSELDKDSYCEKRFEKKILFNKVRDKFLYSLLFTTGLRIEEALQIEMNWFEKTKDGIMINIPKYLVKNRIDKRVPLVKGIEKYFIDYIEARYSISYKIKNKNLLFISYNGFKLDTTDINYGLKEKMIQCKINKKITSHCFRHSLTKILRKRVDKYLIYKILGWIDPDIIGVYDGEASDPTYDKIKLQVCNIL